MAAQSSSSRTHGFTPLFRGPQDDQHLRVSDAERQAVADRLAAHYADGRLDQAEFDERVGLAMSAKTRGDLGGLFADLPDADLPDTGAPAAAELPRRRHRHPVLTLALVVLVTLAAAHAVMFAGPWLWLGFFVLFLLFATGTTGRSRSGEDR